MLFRSPLACEGAGEFAGHFLVPSVHVAHFAATYADVACGNVGERTDVAVKLVDKRLTETHDLHVALAARREVRAAFCTTHGECGKGVLEGLFKCQEFENGEIDR